MYCRQQLNSGIHIWPCRTLGRGPGMPAQAGNLSGQGGRGARAPKTADLAERCWRSAASFSACASACSAKRASGHHGLVTSSLHRKDVRLQRGLLRKAMPRRVLYSA